MPNAPAKSPSYWSSQAPRSTPTTYSCGSNSAAVHFTRRSTNIDTGASLSTPPPPDQHERHATAGQEHDRAGLWDQRRIVCEVKRPIFGARARIARFKQGHSKAVVADVLDRGA